LQFFLYIRMVDLQELIPQYIIYIRSKSIDRMVPLCFLIVSLELFQLVGSSVDCPIGQGLKNEICVDCS
jgi:hypothetical protein